MVEQGDIPTIRARLERILALANAMDNCRECNEDGTCTGCPAFFGGNLCAFEEIGEIVINASAGGDAE